MSVIRLDLDDMNFVTLMKIVDKIKNYKNAKSIEVFESCKMSGYHVQVETFYKMKQKAIYSMRYHWGDHTARLVRDMLGIGDDLLFNFKLETVGTHRHLWERTKMFKYEREFDKSAWRLISHDPMIMELLGKNSQTFIAKQ